MMNNTTDSALLLEEINKSYAKEYIPATVFMTTVIFIGFISNVLAFLYFAFRAPKSVIHLIISVLSLNDAMTDLVLLHDVVEFFYFVNYRSAAACKLFYFLKHLFVGNSLLLIAAIALDRHRLVCHPFAKQITIRVAYYIISGLIIFSLSVSVHYFATSDVTILVLSTDTGASVDGYYCSISEKHPLSEVSGVFHIVDIGIHVVCVGSLVVFYSLVIRKVVHTRLKLKSHAVSVKKSNTTNVNIHPEKETTESSIHSNEGTHTTHISDTDHNSGKTDDNIKCIEGGKKHRKRKSIFHLKATEVKLTIMAFVVAVASVLCFVPYYVSMMLIQPKMDGSALLFTVGEIIARRSFVLNCMVNPIIMMYFNTSFRQFVINSLPKDSCNCNTYRLDLK